MKHLLIQQYNYVKSSRSALLAYCQEIDKEAFIKEVPGFGRGGSIRNLLVHINNTYQHWTGFHCLGRQMHFNEYLNFPDLQSCIALFTVTDGLIAEVLDKFENTMFDDITRDGVTASPLKIFTHVCTHEYHHKGQVLSISRQLGYIPTDTDVVR